MYKLLSKTPGLTKKLSEIEENKNINPIIEKMSEDSKNIDKISKIYGCKNTNELISKIFLELNYNELLLKKIYDYFILMKLKLYKDDTYQESLSKVIPIQSFMEKASNLRPTTGSLDERIVQLSTEKEKLSREIKELKKKNNSSASGDNNNKLFETKDKEINELKKENEKLKKKLEEEKNVKDTTSSVNNSTIFETEIKFKDSQDFKKILEDFENKTKKTREEFCNKISEEIKEIKTKFDKLEENYKVINEERKSLKQFVDKAKKTNYDPDSYEEVLKEQFETMKISFLKKIELLDEELNNVKHESRVKLYQMEEEMKESNYLKNVFLKQVISLQGKLEKQ
jgi:chorismate mutase